MLEKADIKLVATDLDGTFFTRSNPGITQRDIDLIRALQDRGIIFMAASGRPITTVKRVFAPVGRDVVCMGENGGYVTWGEKVLSKIALPREKCFEFIDYVQSLDERYENFVSCPEYCFLLPKRDETIVELAKDWGMPIRVVSRKEEIYEDIMKVTVYFPFGIGEGMAETLTERWDSSFEHVSVAGRQWVDLQDGDKGSALLSVAKELHIDRENIAAFGDNFNDVEMLKAAGHSFAMSGAADAVKAHARYTCDSVQDVLEELLRNI